MFAPQMSMQTLKNLDAGIYGNHRIWWNKMPIDNAILIEEHTEQDFGCQLHLANESVGASACLCQKLR